MGSGDNSLIWWKQVEDMLRKEWEKRLSWEKIIELRDRLQDKLLEVREQKNIRDSMFWCSHCQKEHPMKPVLTVSSIMSRLPKLGLSKEQETKKRKARWHDYKKKLGLSSTGK